MATATNIPIATTTTTSNAATVTVSNIPQGYTDILVEVKTYSTWSSDNGTRLQMYFNGDNSSIYSYTSGETDGSSRWVERGYSGTSMWAGRNNNNYSSNTQKSLTQINILGYSSSTKHKNILLQFAAPQNARTAGIITGTYHSTNPITSISFTTDSNMASGTEVTVYGIL